LGEPAQAGALEAIVPALRDATPWILITLGLWAAAPTAKESRLIEFEIQDQFHHVHRSTDYLGRVIVVIGSGKGGREYNAPWGRALHDSLSSEFAGDELVFVPVADVRGVPFFLKGHVRGKFPREKRKWALVDWKGQFAQAYNWNPQACNLLVFGRDGSLVYQMYGRELEAMKLLVVVNTIRDLLPRGNTQASHIVRSSEAEDSR
jgi:hypothetical protein